MQLEHGMVIYDALYAWCLVCRDETHTWNPRHGREQALEIVLLP